MQDGRDDRLVARVFTPFALRYWRGDTALQAWSLTIILGASVLLGIAVGVVFTYWNRWFFDALEVKDANALVWSLLVVVGIVVVGTAVDVALVLSRETIQVYWRKWFSRELIEKWLARHRFYHLNASDDEESTVPEYRIADDIRWATEPIMDFYIGILGAVVSVASFVGILWVVGGAYTFGDGESAISIPGYMALAGIVHAILLMALMLYCGRKLPKNMAERNEAEAHFRLSMMRVRENADSVALTRGEAGERAIIWRALDWWVRRWMIVVRQDGQLTWILKGNGLLLPVIPFVLAAPKYLSGDLSLGAVMQLQAAYLPFQTSIAWAVDNFRALSNWHASARRVAGLVRSMHNLDGDLDDPTRCAIAIAPSSDGSVEVDGVTVIDREGTTLVREANLVIAPGEKVLVFGESGTGKSALVRAIAGIWPWGSGSVRIPADRVSAMVPQRAYLPLGSLRDALAYPHDRLDADDGDVVTALMTCGIGHLAPRLDTVERWDQLLSSGERQRLAFARVILQRPDFIVLDDPLGGLSGDQQAEMMTLLCTALPDATLFSVAQDDGLARFFDRALALVKAEGGAQLHTVMPHRLVAVGPEDQRESA